MPFNLLEQLFNHLNLIETKLKEQNSQDIGGMSIESGQNSVGEEAMNKISVLAGTLLSAQMVIQEKMQEGKQLSANDAEFVKSFLDDVIKNTSEYLKQDVLYIPSGMDTFVDDLEQALTVFRYQAQQLESLTKEGAQPKTMNDILSDYGWVETVFNDDPDIEKNGAEPDKPWDRNNNTLKNNLDKYKNSVNTAESAYYQHLRKITGSNENPERAFSGKLWLIQNALNTATGSDGKKIGVDFQSLEKVHSAYKDKIYLGNTPSLINTDIMSKTYFDKVIPSLYDNKKITENLNKCNLDPKAKAHFGEALKKLNPIPVNMGVDDKTLQAIDDISELISIPSQIKTQLINGNDGYNPLLSDPPKKSDPLYKSLNKLTLTENRIRGYLEGTSKELVIETAAFGDLIDYLADYAVKAPLFKENNKLNENIYTALAWCKQIGEKIPEFKERAGIAEKNIQSHLNRTLENTCKQFAKCPLESDTFDALWKRISSAKEAGHLDDKSFERISFIRICRDTEYCDEMLKSKDPKKALIAAVAKNEFECATRLANSPRDLKSRILNPYNHALIAGVSSLSKTLSDDEVSGIENFCAKLLSSKGAAKVINASPNSAAKVLNEKNINVLLYGKPIPKAMSGETLDALCQTSGNFNTANSPQYTAIGTAMENLANHAHEPNGPSGEVYKELYDACLTYMYTHNSVPTSSNGKLRFKAAATVLAEIAPKLIEKMPDLEDKIKMDIKTNMIRSKFFRDECVKNDSERFASMADQVEAVLGSEMKKTQLTGKLPEENMQKALLSKFDELEQNFSAKQAKAAEQAKSNDGMKIL